MNGRRCDPTRFGVRAGGGSPASAPGTTRAQQAALRVRGWDRVGEGSEPGREPPHVCTHTPPTHKSAASPGSRPPTPSPGLRCSRLRSPTSYPTPTLSSSTSSPTDPRDAGRGVPALAPAGLGLGTQGARQAEASASWGRVSLHFATPGAELGEGAGQGRKRAGAVFVAALPSGTDGWGGERVRGGRRRGAGADG